MENRRHKTDTWFFLITLIELCIAVIFKKRAFCFRRIILSREILTRTLTGFVGCMLLVTICDAQDSVLNPVAKKMAPWYVEKFSLTAGFFLPANNTDVQVGIKGSILGTDIDLENDLGFNKYQPTFLADIQWRISRKSRVMFNYYNIPRSSTHTIQKELVFHDYTYQVNATVSSFFNTTIYQLSYGYAILTKPDYEVGLQLGAHLVGASAGVSLVGSGAGVSSSNEFGFTAPLPDLGIWGGYAFGNRTAINGYADYLSLTIGSVTGSIFAYDLVFVYKLMDHLVTTLGLTGLNFNVSATKKDVEGNFKWGYNGFALGVGYSFGKKSWGHLP